MDFAAALSASARANQFAVNIIFPQILNSVTSSDYGSVNVGITGSYGAKPETASPVVKYLTHRASIPQFRTSDIEVNYRGRKVHEAGEKEFEPWSCNVYNDEGFRIRRVLEKWDNIIHHPSVIAGLTMPSAYKGQVIVQQLDRNNSILREYTLYGAYVSSIGQIDLDFSTGSEIETYEVSFVYDYFEVTYDRNATTGGAPHNFYESEKINETLEAYDAAGSSTRSNAYGGNSRSGSVEVGG